MTTRSCTGSCSVSVRATHSSPSGGVTSRASARRASETTLANVASRTSRSHNALRAPDRVARSRWVASQAISSTVFERSKLPGSPVRVRTSTPPSRPTTISCGRGSNGTDVTGGSSPLSGSASAGRSSIGASAHRISSTGSSSRSASSSNSVISTSPAASTPTGIRSIESPKASRRHPSAASDQASGRGRLRIGHDDRQAVPGGGEVIWRGRGRRRRRPTGAARRRAPTSRRRCAASAARTTSARSVRCCRPASTPTRARRRR